MYTSHCLRTKNITLVCAGFLSPVCGLLTMTGSQRKRTFASSLWTSNMSSVYLFHDAELRRYIFLRTYRFSSTTVRLKSSSWIFLSLSAKLSKILLCKMVSRCASNKEDCTDLFVDEHLALAGVTQLSKGSANVFNRTN